MKKKYLLFILFALLLVMPLGCKKSTEDEKVETEETTIVEETTEKNNDKEIEESDISQETTEEKEENKKEEKKKNTKTTKEEKKEDKNNTTKKEETSNKNNSSNKGSNETSSNTKTNSSSNSNNNNNSSNKNNSSNSNNSSSNNSSTNENKTEPPKETDEVDTLRNNIQNTYGVTIKYGDEIGSYHPKGLTPTKMTDKNEIKTHLNYIKTELAKYPNGFFKEMKNFDMPLTIYLVKSVPNNSFAGFTDREFTNNIRITIVKTYDFSYTLNHEIMHYIDTYLECKMYPNSPYTEYTALNPPGYNYGNAIAKYNFYYNGADKEVYFMDDYGQTNVREDRAQVFRQMITRSYKLNGMFEEGSVLQSKALIIDKQIRQYYNCASGNIYWDKIIK